MATTQKTVTRSLALIAVIGLSLILTACSAEQVTATLQAVVAATEIALPAIASAADLPPSTVAQIHEYLDAVDDGAIKSTNILANNGYTNAEKATAITGAFASAVVPVLPGATPQKVATRVTAVAAAVGVFLSVIRTTQAEIQFTHPEMVSSFAAKHKALTSKELTKIRRRAEAAKRKIAEARKGQ
jgi:hypothetical protein